MTPVVLGLGSNNRFNSEKGMLEPIDILNQAYKALQGVLTEAVLSPIYITKAMYVTNQPDFHNGAVFGFFDGTPEELLEKTQSIEARFGRDRSKEIRNGQRTLDIDIELFGRLEVNTENLQIPHPRLHERQFILRPLLDILPENADIPSREIFKNYLKNLPDQGVRLYERDTNGKN